MTSKAYLEIGIGDASEFERLTAAYENARAFCQASGPIFGLPSAIDELDDEQREILLEAYDADKAWASLARTCIKPPPLSAGRIILTLRDDVAPKTTANFKCLLTGEKGVGKASKKPLHYLGTKFHRIVKSFCLQGGDFVRGDGSGADSIYGGYFNDEKGGLALKHDRMGCLAMANSGKNTNACQFYLTLGSAPNCDGKHVVFGSCDDPEGLAILKRIDEECASADGSPLKQVTILSCGLL